MQSELVDVKTTKTFITFKDLYGNVLAKVRLDALGCLLQSITALSDNAAIEFSKETVVEKVFMPCQKKTN